MQGGHLVVIVAIQRILEIEALSQRNHASGGGKNQFSDTYYGTWKNVCSLLVILYILLSFLFTWKILFPVWCHYSVGSSAADNLITSVGCFFSFFFFWLTLEACGVLVPWPVVHTGPCAAKAECTALACQGIPYVCVLLGDYLVSTHKYLSLVKSLRGKIVVAIYSVHQGWMFVIFHFRCYK